VIVIGSRAVKAWEPSFREPVDWDISCTLKEYMMLQAAWEPDLDKIRPIGRGKILMLFPDMRVEVEISERGSSSELLNELLRTGEVQWKPLTFRGFQFRAPELLISYLIKLSHGHYPHHWFKTIEDIHWMKERVDFSRLTSRHTKLYLRSKDEAESRNTAPKPKLNMSNEDFFSVSEQFVGRVFDHDELHKAVAFGPVPVHTMAKKNPEKALMSQKMFFKLPEATQLNCVREEAAVIALERKIVPQGKTDEAFIAEAYRWALKRISTDLTGGWFRDFAIDNYPQVKDPGQDFVGRFRAHFELT
jgi:hypothetical protein